MSEVRAFEEMLINMITDAFSTIHTNNEQSFDSIMESIEIILKVVPELHNDFIAEKEVLYLKAKQGFESLSRELETYEDEIIRDFTRSRKEAEISWAYRRDILETVLNIMGKHNKIAFINPDFATIGTPQPATVSSPPPAQPTQAPPPPPPPQQPLPPPPVQTPQPAELKPATPPPPQTPVSAERQAEQITEQQLREILDKNEQLSFKPQNPQVEPKKKSKWSGLISSRP